MSYVVLCRGRDNCSIRFDLWDPISGTYDVNSLQDCMRELQAQQNKHPDLDYKIKDHATGKIEYMSEACFQSKE